MHNVSARRPLGLTTRLAMVGTRSRAIRGKTSEGILWCSASDRIRVPARPASHVHRRVPDVRRRTRRSASTIGGGYTGHDHWTRCRGSRGSASLPAPAAERLGPVVPLFLGLHTQKQSLPVGPVLEFPPAA